MNRSARTVFFTGALLIAAGVVLVVLQFGSSSRILEWIPLIVGLVICAAGFLTAVPGFFIPGFLLAGAGAGIVIAIPLVATLAPARITGIFLVCIACGLGCITPAAALLQYKKVFWPLPPVTLLASTGILLIAAGPVFILVMERVWPFSVAVAVAYFVFVFWRREKV